MRRNAVISEDGLYRYSLERDWSARKQRCIFVMLNPSTADAEKDDPTIRRCIGFAKQWGCGGLTVLNLFAYRATDPKVLSEVNDPIGPENDLWIEAAFQGLSDPIVIYAWGVNAKVWALRCHRIYQIARRNGIKPYILGLLSKEGFPRHPLYLPKNASLVHWRPSSA